MLAIFHQEARDELEQATAHYEKQREGLGEEFAQEVERTIQRILDFPEAWSTLSSTVRRCRLDRFPYGIVYTIVGDDILIVAVMHLRRRPGYWKDRLYG
jgi:plasmid stabilization system protein ParE